MTPGSTICAGLKPWALLRLTYCIIICLEKIPVSVQIQSFMGADSEFHGCEKWSSLISMTCLWEVDFKLWCQWHVCIHSIFSVRFCTPTVPARSFNQWSNRLALSFPWQLQKIDAERFDWNSTIRFKGCGRWKRSSEIFENLEHDVGWYFKPEPELLRDIAEVRGKVASIVTRLNPEMDAMTNALWNRFGAPASESVAPKPETTSWISPAKTQRQGWEWKKCAT